jgi:hypothetical protein
MMKKHMPDRQQGIAMIEAALCLVALLPLALLAISLSTLVHDVGIMSAVSERMIHSHSSPGMVWSAAGDDGAVRVNDLGLRPAIKKVASQGINAVLSQVIGTKSVSALSCYVVYDVDTVSGVLRQERYRVCEGMGGLSERLTIDRLLRERVETARGIPITVRGTSGESPHGYFQQIVLLGLVIGGEFKGIASLLSNEVVMSGVVELPSREVSL